MKSAERAKERLLLQKARDKSADELDLLRSEVLELRIANANWRSFVKELMAEVQSGKAEVVRGRKETSKPWSRLAEAINDSD